MALIVQKFGGSSLAGAERLQRAAERVADTYRRGHRVVAVLSARGNTTDDLLREARGENGFGYDPIFYVVEDGKTMAEMSPERKNEISHRARALQALSKKLGGE